MKKNGYQTCLVYVLIIVVAIIIFKVVKFFQQPDAIQKIIDFIGAIGLCIGAFILFIFGFAFLDSIKTRIDQRFVRKSRPYLARCQVIKMVKPDLASPSDNLDEDPLQEVQAPSLVNVVMTNYGIWFTEKTALAVAVRPELHRYFAEYLENSIIPIRNMQLYYVAYKRDGLFGFELKPSGSIGYSEATPKLPEGYQLVIVIILYSVIRKNDLHKAIKLEQPLKIKLTVVDENEHINLAAALKLYQAIFKRRQATQIEDDDSWMYRSRPIFW